MANQPQPQAPAPDTDPDDSHRKFAKLFDPDQAVVRETFRDLGYLKGEASAAFEKAGANPTTAAYEAALKAEFLEKRPGEKLVGGQWVKGQYNDPDVAAAVDGAVQKESHGGPVTRDMLDGIAKDLQDATRKREPLEQTAGADAHSLGGGLKGLMDMMKTLADFFEGGGLSKIMGSLNGGAPLPASLQPAAAAPAPATFAPAVTTPAFGGAKP